MITMITTNQFNIEMNAIRLLSYYYIRNMLII